MTSMDRTDWAEVFTAVFGAPSSAVMARVHAEVLGDEYPADLDVYSFVTKTDLGRFTANAQVSAGDRIADIGCGRGGPGLWVSAQRNVSLIGIDIAETALESARRLAETLGRSDRAEFRLGSFAETGLPATSVNAVMSVDSLLFAPGKAAALTELARILVPGGRLVLTTWDFHGQPVNMPPQVPDHRPLLEAAGFDVRAYDEVESWRERQIRINELMLDAVDALAGESGGDPARIVANLKQQRGNLDLMTRRVLIVAERR
ncbi:class I SAM-dependent methyltransferase [Amycolatopsis sp. NPDC059021]|uniref:class I SAM-dependent methyltransferase n=1 Tax=Amycolatopsis sp. NPDC059021 TaxID=3346704 RepID=UPI00366EAF93